MQEPAAVPGEPLFATVENDSKVFVDENLHTLWNAGDRISVFDRNTGNAGYVFGGQDGEASGRFTSSAAANGGALDAIYAVYPYSTDVSISTAGALSVNYPAVQNYAERSFGREACIMVCASDERTLHFRNAGGCVILRLYGAGTSVSSVTITGNGGERIAGPATVTVPVGGVPETSMSSQASSSITLNCTPAVKLGASESDCTEFWIFAPPTVFACGFSVTVTSSDGISFTKSTSRRIEVKRSKAFRMEPVEFDAGSETITYTESTADFPNPERGFYKPQEYRPGNSALTQSKINAQRTAGRTLFYLGYYLTSFMESDISSSFLTLMENNFKALRANGAKCILRFAYKDSDADSAKPWDATEAWVLRHIEQISPLLEQYSDVIFVMQAGFVGVWGEWYYTSNFNFKPSSSADYQPRKHVLDALLGALPENRQVAVRTPTFKMKIYGYGVADTLTRATAHDGSVKSRVAGHNDCFLNSSSDSGTYGSSSERTYWQGDSRYFIMGGETCGLSDYCHCAVSGSVPGAIKSMEDYHYSYLNIEYNQDVLKRWQTESCYDEVVRRLGYRLVLREGTFPRKPAAGHKYDIGLRIQNVGFAAPMNPRDAFLVLTNESGAELGRWPLGSDPRTWHRESGIIGISTEIQIPSGASGQCRLWLALPDPEPTLAGNPKFSIRLANDGVWNESKGMNLLADFLIY
ncbi:MAG: DUF4832 domain-containing protein [Bacteroidales bacterium]|nr:DUF4832 domain-containing protein [Bacteroidales bacterium]